MFRAAFLLFTALALLAVAWLLWSGAGWLLEERVEVRVEGARGRVKVARGQLLLQMDLRVREPDRAAPVSASFAERREQPGELFDLADDYAPGHMVFAVRDRLAGGTLRLSAEQRTGRRDAMMGGFVLFLMMGFAALGARFALQDDFGRTGRIRPGDSPASIFLFVGLCLVAVALMVVGDAAWRVRTWRPAPAEETRHAGDAVLALVPGWITLDPEVRERIEGAGSEGTLYTFEGRTYETRPGLCPGDGCRVFVNPRWPRETDGALGWNSETFLPGMILAGFGLAFTGAGWITRRLSL